MVVVLHVAHVSLLAAPPPQDKQSQQALPVLQQVTQRPVNFATNPLLTAHGRGLRGLNFLRLFTVTSQLLCRRAATALAPLDPEHKLALRRLLSAVSQRQGMPQPLIHAGRSLVSRRLLLTRDST